MRSASGPSGGEIVLIGSGGFGRETAQAIHAQNEAGASWRLMGYIDDDPQRAGAVIEGTEVIGGRECLSGFPDAAVVVCTGRPDNYVSRLQIVRDLALPPERYATIVHPAATVPQTCSVGPGTVLLAGVTLTTGVTVGAHVAVMPHVVLTHDDVIMDFATLASAACLGGNSTIRSCAYIGAGALIGASLTVGEYALVGMGAVVVRDIPARQVWAGVPARCLRPADIPDDLDGSGAG